jgi:hypothetical protein
VVVEELVVRVVQQHHLQELQELMEPRLKQALVVVAVELGPQQVKQVLLEVQEEPQVVVEAEEEQVQVP